MGEQITEWVYVDMDVWEEFVRDKLIDEENLKTLLWLDHIEIEKLTGIDSDDGYIDDWDTNDWDHIRVCVVYTPKE